jgi:hypothetical protein
MSEKRLVWLAINSFFLVSVALSSTACLFGQSTEFAPVNVPPGLSTKDIGRIKVFIAPDMPPCKFTTVGTYLTKHNNVFGSQDESISVLKEDAAKRGFDGLFAVDCAGAGIVGNENAQCSAKAYICTS